MMLTPRLARFVGFENLIPMQVASREGGAVMARTEGGSTLVLSQKRFGDIPGTFGEDLDIYDVDLSHRTRLGAHPDLPAHRGLAAAHAQPPPRRVGRPVTG